MSFVLCGFTAAMATLSRGHVTRSYAPHLHADCEVMITCYLLSICSSFSRISTEIQTWFTQLASFCPLHFNRIWIALNCSYPKRCMSDNDRSSLFLWLIKRSWESLHGGTLVSLLANTSPVESLEELNQRWMTCQITHTHTRTHARTHTHTHTHS